ncbi:MAG: hypothetical protein M3007_06255, partial [Candidatus Eremiobacteraeota bacterium]|nr:hypothetical protein [Candidatus Eremiobacteraeota bacterium]
MLIFALAAVASLLLAYLEYRLPALFLAPIATLVVVVTQAVGGFVVGVATAGATAFVFGAAEELARRGKVDGHVVGDVVPLLIAYLL